MIGEKKNIFDVFLSLSGCRCCSIFAIKGTQILAFVHDFFCKNQHFGAHKHFFNLCLHSIGSVSVGMRYDYWWRMYDVLPFQAQRDCKVNASDASSIDTGNKIV